MLAEGTRVATWQHGRSAQIFAAVFVLLVSCPLLFFDLGNRAFGTNDDARYPLLARDIVDSGHWLLPRLNGVPHLNKPPGFAWLIALASWPAGQVTLATAAIPSLFAALTTVAATQWVALTLFDRRTAHMAGAAVITMYGTLTMARVAMPDMALCALATAALAAYMSAEFQNRRRALLGFYGAVAAAFWVKGPPGLLPLAVVLAYTVATHGWRGTRRLLCFPGIALLIGAVGAWALICTLAATPDFVEAVVVSDLLLWYIPTHWRWRLITAPLAQSFTVWLPWSPLVLVAAVGLGASHDVFTARSRRFVLVWLAVAGLLISITAEQRMRYYIVLCPPAALAVGAWLAARIGRRGLRAFGVAWVLIAVAMSLWQVHEVKRHNAATAIDDIATAVARSSHRLYAVDAPELVFAFRLRQPVTILPRFEAFAAHREANAYLVAPPRAFPSPFPDHAGRILAVGRANDRSFMLLGAE